MTSYPHSYLRAFIQEDKIHFCCKDGLVVPRFETRYLKDSLAHRGSVLWNMVTFKEHDIPHLSKKDLYHRIRSRDYVREFKFDAITASSVRRRDSDFIYNCFL